MHKRLTEKLRNSGGTSTEKLIKEATYSDSWGPTGTELNQLAILSHNSGDLKIITKVLNKRLRHASKEKEKEWRCVLKSLTIIQFMLQVGSLDFVAWCRSIRSILMEYKRDYPINYKLTLKREDISKQISSIKKKCESILKLLDDEKLLEQKRVDFHKLRSEMSIPGFHDSKRHGIDNRQNSDAIDIEEILDFGLTNKKSNLSARAERSVKSLEINRSQIFGSLNVFDSASSDEEDHVRGNGNSPKSSYVGLSGLGSPSKSTFSNIPPPTAYPQKYMGKSSSKLTTLMEEEDHDESNKISHKLRNLLMKEPSLESDVIPKSNSGEMVRSLTMPAKSTPLSLSINTDVSSSAFSSPISPQQHSYSRHIFRPSGNELPSAKLSSPLSITTTPIPIVKNSTQVESPLRRKYTPGSPSSILSDTNPFKILVELEEKAES